MNDDVDDVNDDDDKMSRVLWRIGRFDSGRFGSVFRRGSAGKSGRGRLVLLQPTKRFAARRADPRSVRHELTNWRCDLNCYFRELYSFFTKQTNCILRVNNTGTYIAVLGVGAYVDAKRLLSTAAVLVLL